MALTPQQQQALQKLAGSFAGIANTPPTPKPPAPRAVPVKAVSAPKAPPTPMRAVPTVAARLLPSPGPSFHVPASRFPFTAPRIPAPVPTPAQVGKLATPYRAPQLTYTQARAQAMKALTTPSSDPLLGGIQAGLKTISQGAGAVVSDIPREMQGTGAITGPVRGALSSAGRGIAATAAAGKGQPDPLLGGISRAVSPQGAIEAARVGSNIGDYAAKGFSALEQGAFGVRSKIAKATIGGSQPTPKVSGGGATPIASVSLGTAIPLEAARWAISGVQQGASMPAEILPSAAILGYGIEQAVTGNPKLLKSIGSQQLAAFTTAKGLQDNWLNDLFVLRGAVDAGTLSLAKVRDITQHLPKPAADAFARALGRNPESLTRATIQIKNGVEVSRGDYARSGYRRAEQKFVEKARGKVPDMTVGPGKYKATTSEYDSAVNHMVDRMHGHAVRTSGDMRNAITNDVLTNLHDTHEPSNLVRQAGQYVAHPDSGLIHPVINGSEAENLFIQGYLRPGHVEDDLRRVEQDLEGETRNLEPDSVQWKRAQQQLGQIKALLNNRQFLDHPEKVIQASRRESAQLNAQQPELERTGQVHPVAAERSPKTVFMYRHMGGRMGPTPEALLHEQKLAELRTANSDLKFLGDNPTNRAMQRKTPYGTDAARARENKLGIFQAQRIQRTLIRNLERQINGRTERHPDPANPGKFIRVRVPGTKAHAGETGLIHPDTLTHLARAHEGEPNPLAGQLITNEQADIAMRKEGIEPEHLAHISHDPVTVLQSAQKRYRGFSNIPAALTKRRTMESQRLGQNDITTEGILKQRISSAIRIHRHDYVVNFLNHFMLSKQRDAPFFNDRTTAEEKMGSPEFLEKHGVPPGTELALMKIPEGFPRSHQLGVIRRALSGSASLDTHDTEASLQRQDGTPFLTAKAAAQAGGTGRYAIVIKRALDRQVQLEQDGQDALQRAVGTASGLFRMSTLPFSVARLIGVPFETGTRLAIRRAGPLSARYAGTRLKAMGELANMPLEEFSRRYPKGNQRDVARIYAEVRSQLHRGTVGGQALYDLRYSPAGRFKDVRLFNTMQRLSRILQAAPGPGHLIRLFRQMAKGILSQYYGRIEAMGQRAAWGKYELEQAKAEGKTIWGVMRQDIRAHQDLLMDGRMNTRAQHEALDSLDRAMGKWANQGPVMRSLLRYAPFLSWPINALQFLYAVLPQDHATITGLLAAANSATAQQRQAIGLSGPISASPDVPGYLESGLPLPPYNRPGTIISGAGHYFVGSSVGDPLGSVGDILPWLVPWQEAALGVDFTGRYPKNAQGQRVAPDAAWRIEHGILGTLESLVPGAQTIVQAATNPKSFANPLRIRQGYIPGTSVGSPSSSRAKPPGGTSSLSGLGRGGGGNAGASSLSGVGRGSGGSAGSTTLSGS